MHGEQMQCLYPPTVTEQSYLGVALLCQYGEEEIKGSLNSACSKRYLEGGHNCIAIQLLQTNEPKIGAKNTPHFQCVECLDSDGQG